MKRFLSIFFAVLLFIGGLFCNDMEEVFKIPSLISHYFEHKEAAGEDLSFMDFLAMHYGADHTKDSADKDLPFYEHNIPALAFTVSCPYKFPISFSDTYIKHSSLYRVSVSEEAVFTFLKPPQA